MAKDIAPALLEVLKEEFNKKLTRIKKLKKFIGLYKKVKQHIEKSMSYQLKLEIFLQKFFRKIYQVTFCQMVECTITLQKRP